VPQPDLQDPGALIDSELSLHLVEAYIGNVHLGWAPAYRFEMRIRNATVKAGRINLRISHALDVELYAGHIGYDVEPRYRGHRYAARSCILLLPLAKRHGLDPLWITCNPDNIASRRTCELIGAQLIETIDLPPDNDMYRLLGERQKCRYRLDVAAALRGLSPDAETGAWSTWTEGAEA